MAKPDHIYNPDDWECTYDYEDRYLLVEDEPDPGEYRRFATLLKGPDVYAARVITKRDEAGDVEETEVRWFDSEAEARAACGMPAHLVED
jgi:hypothetical protein